MLAIDVGDKIKSPTSMSRILEIFLSLSTKLGLKQNRQIFTIFLKIRISENISKVNPTVGFLLYLFNSINISFNSNLNRCQNVCRVLYFDFRLKRKNFHFHLKLGTSEPFCSILTKKLAYDIDHMIWSIWRHGWKWTWSVR